MDDKIIKDYWDGYEWIDHNRKVVPRCHRCGSETERLFVLRGDYGCSFCLTAAMNSATAPKIM